MSFCSGMFSLTSSGLALYDHFGTESNEALMEELEVIEQQLEEIQNIIDDLMSTVKEESVKMQYVNAQRIIMEGLRCYNTYANMTNPVDQLYWSKEFLKWGSFLRESVNFMMDGMLGTGFGLINAGLVIQSTFTGFNNISWRAKYVYNCKNIYSIQ